MAEAAVEPNMDDELFRALNSSSFVGLFLTDDEGHGTYANPRCQAILGHGFAEGLGNSWAQLADPVDRERVVAAWSAAVRDEREFEGQYRVAPVEAPLDRARWVR